MTHLHDVDRIQVRVAQSQLPLEHGVRRAQRSPVGHLQNLILRRFLAPVFRFVFGGGVCGVRYVFPGPRRGRCSKKKKIRRETQTKQTRVPQGKPFQWIKEKGTEYHYDRGARVYFGVLNLFRALSSTPKTTCKNMDESRLRI